MILAVTGSVVIRNVRTDITHSGRDLDRVRAEFAAESAIQWALAELARPRPGELPFSRATHGADGSAQLPEKLENGKANPRKLRPADIAAFPNATTALDRDGWMVQRIPSRSSSITGGADEALSFKIWYPDDSTLRITGRGSVEGTGAEMDLVSVLREVAVPL